MALYESLNEANEKRCLFRIGQRQFRSAKICTYNLAFVHGGQEAKVDKEHLACEKKKKKRAVENAGTN